MNELVAQSQEFTHDIGMTDEVSWVAPANLTLTQYLSIANTLRQIQKSLAYWYGDLLVEGERLFGEDFAQAIPEIGRASETLLKYKAVAARVPREIRQAGLTWTHSFYCAYVEEEHRGPLLELALNVGLSSRELKEVAKLPMALRDDVMAAAAEGMEHDEVLALVNKLKIGNIGKPARTPFDSFDDDDEDKEEEKEESEDEDKDEEIPFSDLDDDDGSTMEVEDDERDGLSCEDLFDYWENSGVPLTHCGPGEAIWQGLAVRAAMDGEGKMVLVWEEIP